MPHHEAIFRFFTQDAVLIHKALLPELSDEVNPRSKTSCWLEDKNTLLLKIEAEDTAALRAALNMALRLVNVADEMQQIVMR
ncbi:MAG: KEOPS complex subunit Pcc1 [Methanoregula sp.]|nr:KEOPS complex subunit Pcc1 [Methanoregula sp.]